MAGFSWNKESFPLNPNEMAQALLPALSPVGRHDGDRQSPGRRQRLG